MALTGADLSRQAAIAQLAGEFAAGQIESPALDARLLVCAAAGLDRAALLRDPDLPLGQAAALVQEYARRRLAGEPVARILGHREFWSFRLRVTPDVLDPRADTEVLVEAALAFAGARRDEALHILDLGTGSGALLAALLTEWPKAQGLGIDRSAQACAVAQGNLDQLGLGDRGRISCADWNEAFALSMTFDLVVSNPPYIETAIIATLAQEVRAHDPPGALDGGVDGLDCYRRLAKILPALLKPGGIAILELGAGQAKAVRTLAEASGLEVLALRPDLAGIERALVLRRASRRG